MRQLLNLVQLQCMQLHPEYHSSDPSHKYEASSVRIVFRRGNFKDNKQYARDY